MTVPQTLSGPLALSTERKKRVLLVDASLAKRDLGAEVMRKLGMDVDCAADISEARSWWRADLYNLVLIRDGNALQNCGKFCDDVRKANPPQRLGFLVGKPAYIADAPLTAETLPDSLAYAITAAEPLPENTSLCEPRSQRWGILEASRRISEVRSAAHARNKAFRERPAPPRDSETRASRPRSETRKLDFLKEETL